MKNLTLVIPAKNERDSLPKVLDEIKDYDCKIIVVLESSDIETIDAIKTGEQDLRSIDMPKWLLMIPFPIGFSLVAIEFFRYLLGFDTYYSNKASSGESL